MSDKMHFCQSCGMPLEDTSVCGTNADGGVNAEYCRYCFQNGDFTETMTMDDMIRMCVPHMVEAHPDITAEHAEAMMRKHLPTLKRWQTA